MIPGGPGKVVVCKEPCQNAPPPPLLLLCSRPRAVLVIHPGQLNAPPACRTPLAMRHKGATDAPSPHAPSATPHPPTHPHSVRTNAACHPTHVQGWRLLPSAHFRPPQLRWLQRQRRFLTTPLRCTTYMYKEGNRPSNFHKDRCTFAFHETRKTQPMLHFHSLRIQLYVSLGHNRAR